MSKEIIADSGIRNVMPPLIRNIQDANDFVRTKSARHWSWAKSGKKSPNTEGNVFFQFLSTEDNKYSYLYSRNIKKNNLRIGRLAFEIRSF